ncbi:MAG: organoarsenical effux MFS transporter ArsJ [Proteobacteria bacterium]|nr:organoarsenical effux MFS transporter ArsJ [Pseudomonadota bacterium]
MTAPMPSALPAYIAVTAAYWAFMLSDGALRMLVLLAFHERGFSPVQLAYLFLLYELAGVITNLSAGWLAARFGLTRTLYTGLILQVGALLALTALDPAWSIGASVTYVMAVQGASGVAKDLAKMSSKSAVKHLAPEGAGLLKWVSWLTGSKNAVKGLGFLLGAGLLALYGYNTALLGMAAILALILLALLFFMPDGLPKGNKATKFSTVISRDKNINRLSAARVFLFGARDVWFVVGIPVYFYAVLSDGSDESRRAAFFMIGTFMAVWIILYGAVQAMAPRILRKGADNLAQLSASARQWALALVPIPTLLAVTVSTAGGPAPWLTVTLVLGLLVFGAVFAVNSALHSYLILAFSKSERVSQDVGFYYMANAAGRLLGTGLSGLAYQWGGVEACLMVASGLLALSAVAANRLNCGRA